MADTELRRIPIHRALNRPDLIAGCERELLLTIGFLCLALIMVGLSWMTSLTALVLWVVSAFLLRKMAKADPFMSKIYIRHVRYRHYYPARSTPWAEGAVHKR